MTYYKKHIPKNSVNFIIKFDNKKDLRECIESEEFQSTQGRLANILLAHGGQIDMFTNPKKI